MSDDKRDTGTDPDFVESTVEPVEGHDPDTYDNPNQQVVRPDGSGPADEGEGGSTKEIKPSTDEEKEARKQAEEDTPDDDDDSGEQSKKSESKRARGKR